MGGEEDEAGYRNESDYLLPGGEWDPSLSASVAKRRSRRSRGGRAGDSGSFADNGAGGEDSESLYTPPEVPGATSVPKFEDFKLLKTVGKGAFGKVLARANKWGVARFARLLSSHTSPFLPKNLFISTGLR